MQQYFSVDYFKGKKINVAWNRRRGARLTTAALETNMAIWFTKKCMERKLNLRIEKVLAYQKNLLPLHPPVENIRNHTVWIFYLHNTVLSGADFC